MVEFSEKSVHAVIDIVNLRKKNITISVSIPKKELLRSDTISSSPKSIEIKAREKGKLTLTFHSTENTWPISYSSIITLMLEMEGKKKKSKSVSSYFINFTVKRTETENSFPISARSSYGSSSSNTLRGGKRV